MPRKKNKPLDGFVITRARYVVNQKAPRFEDSRTKRIRTRGAKARHEIALSS